MSGEYPFPAKTVSPVKCNEKPWDLWVSEIGQSSPRRDDGAAVFATPAELGDKAAAASARRHKASPRRRRPGLSADSMSLHGLFPQMDSLNAAVCHMCGVVVKCSAAYRHLLDSHTGTEPILPPPPPAPTVKLKSGHSRSRHKKEAVVPPPPVETLPVKMETSPVHTATAPLPRIVIPQPELQYLEEASTSAAVATGEVQVCMETGELPVVSIQDTEDLPLGENITDDIFAIMNSEGIQSAEDITNAADWKNIIRDIGNMQEINFSQTTDSVQSQDMFTPVDTSLSAYTINDTDLSSIQFAPNSSPMLSTVIDSNVLNAQAYKPPATPSTPSTKSTSRSKTSKTKFNLREYDPNKHCGVISGDNLKPCTRSLTCKAHALSLRRMVEGRAKPFDTLLAEHRASRDAALAPAAPPLPAIDLAALNHLTAEQQVNDIYASLLNVEDPNSVLPDASTLSSLLIQPLPTELLLPDEVELPAEVLSIAPAPVIEPLVEESPPPLVPGDVCWYSSCPRPLALCTFNASHAGGAITLGKKFATVRSNIKSSLSRSQCKAPGAANSYYFNQNALSLSKTVHMNNASKSNKPEVRKLIVTCSGGRHKEVHQTLSELFAPDVRLNGHARPSLKAGKRAPHASALDLGFPLDPLLADEKC